MDEGLIAIELEVFVEEGRPQNATDLALSEKMLDTLTTVVRASKKVNELIAVGKPFGFACRRNLRRTFRPGSCR